MPRPKGAKNKTTIAKEQAQKIICLKCHKEKQSNATNYYMNGNPLFDTEKLEVCKDCITKYIGEKGSEGYLDRVKLVLALLDKPFLKDLWEMRDSDWSKYIPQLSSFNQYKGLTYADSKYDDIQHKAKSNTTLITNEDINDVQKVDLTKEELQELVLFWGKGMEPEDYEFLQMEYEKLLNSYECDTYAMEMLFQEASQTRLTIKKKREANQSVDKEVKTLQDLLGSANIKPVQESGANATDQESFGTLIKKYENERPIPEPEEEWKDVDGISHYVKTWFLGHLTKMLGIKNEFTEEYERELEQFTVENPIEEPNDDSDDEEGHRDG